MTDDLRAQLAARQADLAAQHLIEWPPGSGTVYTAEAWRVIPEDVLMARGVADLIHMLGGPRHAEAKPPLVR